MGSYRVWLKKQRKMNEEVKRLVEKIEGMSERIKQLKMQGESSNKPPIKSIRNRRVIALRELIKIISPETSYYKNQIQDASSTPGESKEEKK